MVLSVKMATNPVQCRRKLSDTGERPYGAYGELQSAVVGPSPRLDQCDSRIDQASQYLLRNSAAAASDAIVDASIRNLVPAGHIIRHDRNDQRVSPECYIAIVRRTIMSSLVSQKPQCPTEINRIFKHAWNFQQHQSLCVSSSWQGYRVQRRWPPLSAPPSGRRSIRLSAEDCTLMVFPLPEHASRPQMACQGVLMMPPVPPFKRVILLQTSGSKRTVPI